jgi:uncharacterized protein YqhQ
MNVGGQAVIEGVMMRTPHSFTVAVRRPDGEIVVREDAWQSVWDRYRFLRWPFFRGTVVMIESLVNGMQALSWSASQAYPEEEGSNGEPVKLSSGQIAGTLTMSMLMGIGMFVVLPHMLTYGIGWALGTDRLDPNGVLFHLVDGLIKLTLFVGYIAVISMMKDIQRVFQYHGAEHKSIYTFEAGEELTVENARKYTTLHPRCGTSFLMFVVLVSIFLFTGIFPLLMPSLQAMPALVRNLAMVAIKIPLMLPIAGISYEAIKWSGKHAGNPLLGLISRPGLWMQNLTTREPSDDQLEVALESLKRALALEASYQQAQAGEPVLLRAAAH